MTIVLVAAGAIALAAVFFASYGRENGWKLIAGNPDLGQFDLAVPVRSPRPNDALMCTPGICEGVKVDAALPQYDLAPDTLIAAVDRAIQASGEIAKRVDDGSDPAMLRYVTRTPGLRFPDTNSFQAVALPDGKTGLAAYARAQLGYSDRGANRKRLKRILRRIRTPNPAAIAPAVPSPRPPASVLR